MTTGLKLSVAVSFVFLIGTGRFARADTIQLSPSKDNTLYQDDSGQLSNGRGENFFAGRTSSGLIRRGLIAFDIACNIPSGSTIQGVRLVVHVSQATDPEIEIDLRSALTDWGEGDSVAKGMGGAGGPAQPGDATWLHRFFDNQFWNSQGGDFTSTVSSSAAVSSPGFYTFDSMFDPGLVSDVQRWLDQPTTNFGWGFLEADESFPRSAKRFDSRENSNPAFRPVLIVTYAAANASRSSP